MSLLERLKRRRTEAAAETTTEVMPCAPSQAEPVAEPGETPEAPEPGSDAACPMCGKSPDECTCAPASETDQDHKPDQDESGSSAGMNHRRSGDNDMQGTTTKSATPNAATLAELRAVKSFGMDAAFCVECVEKQLTMLQAHEAYAEKQQAVISGQNQKIAGLTRLGGEGIGGTTPVSTAAPTPGARASRGKPQFAHFDEAVEFYQSDRGGKLSRFKATREAAVNYPELHQAKLAEDQAVYARHNASKVFA